MNRGIRLTLVAVTGFVALTAFLGGAVLIMGSLSPGLGSVLVPPADYLRGSPFSGYAVPGLVLMLLVGGPQAVASIGCGVRWPWAPAACAAAGFSCLIWIFVQMIYIPFSPLQAVYFAFGMLELGLLLLGMGVLHPAGVLRHGSVRRASTRHPVMRAR
ncbi:hypothetical protein [Microbacterium rhizosphaerae]|uniref:DUF4345 domain-containing protein n=1 Tax=Microbacterium rhizosphaerae TaxID=1678237 RepID=A0ABZ0SHT4_9MICO|nr:hypothetical protein [Microbacterium rhizosphaerae]WPR88299.1 hypothetical protein SM116_10945 [Microbacterium rhizosphaerae]